MAGWPLLAVWVAYVLLPFLDVTLPYDLDNPNGEQEKTLATETKWKLPLWTYTILDLAALYWFLEYATATTLPFFSLLAVLFTVGNFSTGGINVAHECMHKTDLLNRVMTYAELTKCLYSHFAIEHVKGHHMNVATPEDPATAKKGQSLYAFFPQTVIGGWRHAWKLETERMTRMGESQWSVKNMFLVGKCIEVLLTLIVIRCYGLYGLFLFVAQSCIGFGILEAVNYVEHYGLQRAQVANGYEPVAVHHSWNAPFLLTNWLFFKLQRHSDHHYQGSKPYQVLRTWEEAPVLPGSYPLCVIVATVPPLWFSLMHPLLDKSKGSMKRFKQWLGVSLAMQGVVFSGWFLLTL